MEKSPITGDKVDLRERVKEDLNRELIWKEDKETAYLEGVAHEGYKIPDYDVAQWSQVSQSGEFKREKIVFSIYTKENIHIGTAGFFADSEDRISGEVGITIGEKDYRSRGYGTEGLKLFIKYLFEEEKIKKLYGVVYKFNERAYKTALRAGFKEKKVINKYHSEYGFYDKVIFELQ